MSICIHTMVSMILLMISLHFIRGEQLERNCSWDSDIADCFCTSTATDTVPDPFRGLVLCKKGGMAYAAPLACVTVVPSNSTTDDPPSIVAGHCPFTGSITAIPLTGRVSELNEIMCTGGSRHRGDLLCGNCLDNYSISLNSPDLHCLPRTKCNDYYWILYFLTEFIGISIFFLVILTLNVRVTANGAAGSLLLAQILALPISVINFRRDWAKVFDHSVGKSLSSIIELLYGVFNLNIQTGVIKDLCVDTTSISPSGLYALQYTSSVFPLLLILLSFALIKLYERNFQLIVWTSRPLRHLWHRFRRKLDSRATIIDIFASFLILSYAKLAHTSFVLITPTNIYNYNGSCQGRVMIYDGTIKYFGTKHLPYAILAIVVLCFVVVPPPLLLLFYQFRWFQLMVTRFRLNNHLLAMFVHSFQRGFKDGSTGETKDLRFFSAMYFIFRIIVFGIYSLIGNYFVLYYTLHVVSLSYAFIIGVFRPYKNDYYNKAECFIGLFMSFLTSTAIQNGIFLFYRQPVPFLAVLLFILALFPMLYMTGYIMVWFLKNIYRKNKERILRRLDDESLNHPAQQRPEPTEQDHLFHQSNQSTGSNQSSGGRRVRHAIRNLMVHHSLNTPINEHVPDRLSNPNDYSDLEYQWEPENDNTDTDTGTTTDRSTAATGSTMPRSTYTDQATGRTDTSLSSVMSTTTNQRSRLLDSANRRKNQSSVRPTSLSSIRLQNFSQDRNIEGSNASPDHHPNTN